MEAKDLRMGNFVDYYLEPPISENQLVEIDISELRNISEGWKNYNPIPITEEWLVRFGFGHGKKIGYFGNDFINGFMTVIISEHHIKIKHVHQLQNLYFALTGEELTIINK